MLIDRPCVQVMVVSNIRLYRDGICDFLAGQSDVRVYVAAGPIERIMAAIDRRAPDIVLLDGTLPDGLILAAPLARPAIGLDAFH